MSDNITVTGLVATIPNHTVTGTGLAVTTFRLASNQRRYDRAQQKWVDGETNWYTVAAFRQLATNIAGSVQKGQRVIVTGKLKVRDWESEDKRGRTVEIDADAIGHDLTWGTAAFVRSASAAVAEADAAAEPDAGGADGSAAGAGVGESAALEPDGAREHERETVAGAPPF